MVGINYIITAALWIIRPVRSFQDFNSPHRFSAPGTPAMLSTSLRRAAWAHIVPVSGITRPSGRNLAARAGRWRRVHQRRYSSSSKPPVPPSDGSRRMDTSAPAKEVNSSGERGKTARRRGKDGNSRNGSSKSNQQHTAFSKLPSVPSTQHQEPRGKWLLHTYIFYCTARAEF